MAHRRVDAFVIGAGAGGLCAAARLAHAGLQTLVVDDRNRIGGRASTEEIDGFTVNIGAIAIELGGVFEETFNTVGARLDIRTPEPASSFYIDGKLIDVGRGGWSLLLGQLTKQASRILEKFADARAGNLPDGRQSTEDWLKSYTSNASVHAIFRNLCAAIFACNADELPARAFLTYFTSKGAFKRFGFCPEGTIGVWNALASVIKRNGDIWLATPAVAIHRDRPRHQQCRPQDHGRTRRRRRIPSSLCRAGTKRASPRGQYRHQYRKPTAADFASGDRDIREDPPALQHGEPHGHLP
jgi:phytoene dehydrogenase-like protein